jgi:hypothetical protein
VVDLSKEKKLYIQAVDGSTVTEYLYGARQVDVGQEVGAEVGV